MSNTIELLPGQLADAANPVRNIEHLEDVASDTVSVADTATLETLIGSALNARIAAITLIIDPMPPTKDVNYNPVGAATGSNGALFPGVAYTAFGAKAKLDAIQLFATGATSVTVIQHALIQDT